jgi:hypothetical protein
VTLNADAFPDGYPSYMTNGMCVYGITRDQCPGPMYHQPLCWNGLRWGKQLIISMLDCSKPIIAKINGHASPAPYRLPTAGSHGVTAQFTSRVMSCLA